jgi:hypothetical protein
MLSFYFNTAEALAKRGLSAGKPPSVDAAA